MKHYMWGRSCVYQSMVSKPRFGVGLLVFVSGVSIGNAITAIYFIYAGSGVSVIAGITSVSQGAIGPLISALTIGVGGVIATVAWWWYRKPKLNLGDPAVVRGLGRESDLDRLYKYRINIKNNGRRAATNCKAKLVLNGEFGTERFRAESLLQWSQGEHTISINAGEEALVEILTASEWSDIHGHDWKVAFVSGLSDEEKISIELYDADTGAFEELWVELTRETLLNTDFTRHALIVTAENCQRQEFRVGFQADDPLEVVAQPA